MHTKDMDRFIKAHESQYEEALSEIRAGRKQSHWIWFIFPQIAGLGFSPMSQRYALSGLEEARAFLACPVLSAHLKEICQALLSLKTADAEAVMGPVDSVKLRSSMTLFHLAAPEEPIFASVLAKFYGSRLDQKTVALLQEQR